MMIAPSDLADLAEAALDAVEPLEPLQDRSSPRAELERDGGRGERIQDIVPAGHGHVHAFDRPAASVALQDHGVKPAAARFCRDIVGAKIGKRREAVCNDPPVADARKDALHFGMIDAEDREPVERHILDELAIGLLHPLEVAVMFEMLGIDVGDDGDRPVEAEEAAVALVGLDDHPVALAQPRVGAVAIDDAAVDDGRVDAAGIQQRSDHRRRRRLAVRPGDRDRLLHAHQLGEHLRAPDERQPPLDRGFDLGIAAADGGRDHDDGRFAQIVGRMADGHRNAVLPQLLDDIAVRHVGALHRIAELVHHLGDARHADAADADEVDRPDVGAERSLHAGTPPAGTLADLRGLRAGPTRIGTSPSPIRSTRSARSRAACGRPTDKARVAALSRATGSAAIASI